MILARLASQHRSSAEPPVRSPGVRPASGVCARCRRTSPNSTTPPVASRIRLRGSGVCDTLPVGAIVPIAVPELSWRAYVSVCPHPVVG